MLHEIKKLFKIKAVLILFSIVIITGLLHAIFSNGPTFILWSISWLICIPAVMFIAEKND